MRIRLLFFVISCLVLQSCNQFMAPRNDRMRIKSNRDFTLETTDETYTSKRKKVKLITKRSPDSLKLVLTSEGQKLDTLSAPRNSTEYIADRIWTLGIPFNYYLKNKKRYKQPKKLWLEVQDEQISISRFKTYHKGEMSLNFSLPYLNYVNYDFSNYDNFNRLGFFGFGAGLEYYLNYKRSIEFNVSWRTQTTEPFFPFFERDDFQLSSFSLRYHYFLNRFDLAAGLSYDHLIYGQDFEDFPDPPETETRFLGFYLSAKYRISDSGWLGLEYKPSYFNLESSDLNRFNTVVSLAIKWRIRLYKTHD